MNEQNTSTRDIRRDELLGRLDLACAGVERIADLLPARGESFPRDHIRIVLHDLGSCLVALTTAEERICSWSMEVASYPFHRHVRADENRLTARTGLAGLQEAHGDNDECRALTTARDCIDHLRRCADHLRNVLENRDMSEAAA